MNFQPQAWPDFPDELWADAREQAIAAELPRLEERLIGSDIDGHVLRAARENAERAGVADDIHFQSGAMQRLTSKRRFGCLITNPPYGERIGEIRELNELYEQIPHVLRNLPTWSHYILTAFPRFEQTVGRTADRRRKLYNGRIECTYYQYHGPKPIVGETPAADTEPDSNNRIRCEFGTDRIDAVITAPPRPYVHASGPAAFGHLGEKAKHQAELFAARLTKRARHLRRWPTRRGITCFRLYERDIPEIPLVVDRYENYLHMTEYERPHDRDPAEHANWLDLMAQTAAETLDSSAKQCLLQASQSTTRYNAAHQSRRKRKPSRRQRRRTQVHRQSSRLR